MFQAMKIRPHRRRKHSLLGRLVVPYVLGRWSIRLLQSV
jgi:hypothetical protein